MPDEKKIVDKPEADPPLAELRAIRTAEALAKAEADAEKRQLDETVEGGRYKVGDEFVDADGKPVKGK